MGYDMSASETEDSVSEDGRYQQRIHKLAIAKRYPFDSGHTALYPSRDVTLYARMMTDFAHIRAKTQEIKDTQQAEPIQEFAENAEHSIQESEKDE
ncbi:unnamed protein product [Clonostachys chloroleuca]|uniref:Uncharacterized protein n=1 Tax=Clonostachys chloroleuca TaxID=1926264 RepID=A0AA35QEF0_9HYPO|nr:unnamed protein product [Clonostachys chloroleuca]